MAAPPNTSDSGTPAPSDDGSSEIIFKGILTKQGKKHKTWRKRIMLLRKDHRIYYYKDTEKPPLGFIPLTDTVFSFRQGWQDDCNWPRNVDLARTIAIATEERTFYLYADTLAEVEQWLEQLAFVEKFQKQKQKKAAGGDTSRAMKSRMKKDKLNRQKTQRFQSSEDGSREEGKGGTIVSSDSSSSDLENLDMQNVSSKMAVVGVYASLDQEPCDDPKADESISSQSQQDDKAQTEVSALNPSDDQELYIVPDEESHSVTSTPSNSGVQEEKRLVSSPLPPIPTETDKAQADKEQDIYEYVADDLYESVHVEDVRTPDGSESPSTDIKAGDKSQPVPPPLPKERVSAPNIIQKAPDNFEPEDFYGTVDEKQGNGLGIPTSSSRPLTLRPPLPKAESSGNSDAFEPAESADDFYTNVDLEHGQEVCYEEMTSPELQDITCGRFPVSSEDTKVDDQQLYDLPNSPSAIGLTHPSGPVEICLVATDSSGYIPMGSSTSRPVPQDSEATAGENTEERESASFKRQGSRKSTKSEEGGYKTVMRDSTSSERSDLDPEEAPVCDDASQEVKDPQPSPPTTVQATAKLDEGEPLSMSTAHEPTFESNEPISSKEPDEQDSVLVVHQSSADADATSTISGQESSPSAPDQTKHSSEQSQSTTDNMLDKNESLPRRSGSFMFKQRQSKAIKESAKGTMAASSSSALEAKIAVDIVTLEREKQQVHEEKRRLEQEWQKLQQEWQKLQQERQKLAQEKEEFRKFSSKN